MTIKRKQSREDSQTKIQDESIAPYFIYFDGTTYTLVKEKNNGGEDNIGYYTNLSNTLKSVTKLLVNESKTLTITEFIKKYDEVMNKLSEKFEI
jgi:hypothetical protein